MTLELAGLAMLMSIVVAIPLGVGGKLGLAIEATLTWGTPSIGGAL